MVSEALKTEILNIIGGTEGSGEKQTGQSYREKLCTEGTRVLGSVDYFKSNFFESYPKMTITFCRGDLLKRLNKEGAQLLIQVDRYEQDREAKILSMIPVTEAYSFYETIVEMRSYTSRSTEDNTHQIDENGAELQNLFNTIENAKKRAVALDVRRTENQFS
jgi:hypothetical protein